MAPIFAQSADEGSRFEEPWKGPASQLPAFEGASLPPPGEALASDLPIDAAPASEPPIDVDLSDPEPEIPPLDEFLGYRYEAGSVSWMVGNGDQFGMVSLESEHYVSRGVKTGLGVGLKFHFLGGPVKTDMPPRVFDFSLGFQRRDQLGVLRYDVATSVVASSDFEGSSREGIRFPSHAVGFVDVGPSAELVFGVDYLDRGDVKLLPVGGLILLPTPDLRLEAVFPRPRAVFRLTDTHRLFLAGELGGGTWAIERETGVDDLATYHDLRLSIGIEHVQAGGDRSAFEVAYLFDRRLEYTSGQGDCHLGDTAMLRFVHGF
jgi:hypothetical protein